MHQLSKVLIKYLQTEGEKCSGACLSRKSSDGGLDTLEDPHRPPCRTRAPPALAPGSSLPTPQELLPELLPAILYNANV
jgi:hypothetical protein